MYISPMKISILGAGNVATQLALAFKKAGHEIVQVYNRSDDAGLELAKTVGASFTSDLTDLRQADILMVAVKDDAIPEVAAALHESDTVVAHTSGTRSKEILGNSSVNYGIFYPLQTLKKSFKVDFKNVPVLIEGSNAVAGAKLQALAKSISQNVHVVDEQQRQWIHVAAVFANNFTNHLYGISEKLLVAHQLPFEVLKPLIFRSIENLTINSPNDIQTGPAVRKDFKTIEKHMQLLADDSRLLKIYEVLTESIIATQTDATE
jgi:predicted short-subunit dehydrogenase-like oxidoreductase (DUF2520 family)